MRTEIFRSRRALLAAGAGAAVLAAAGWAGRGLRQPGTHAFHGQAMGSTYTVKIHAPRATEAAIAEARRAVARALGEVEARMSTYEPGSELSRFNRHAGGTPFALSTDLARVFGIAKEVSAASRGAFDITVAPVVDLWGFGPVKHADVPLPEDRRRALASVDWRALRLDSVSGRVTKALPGLAADLSGIAQGYGSDRAAEALERLGFEYYLVDVSGEIRTRGLGAGGEPWRVGIERPDSAPRQAHRIVPLSGRSLATSGDYRIFFEQEGRRYSHEIDPATGEPVAHRLASVSVLAADCTRADAWSTALFVLGPRQGPQLAESLGMAAHFIVRTPAGGYEDLSTPAFRALG
jgi:thiamine biosynthesis lipoprotein